MRRPSSKNLYCLPLRSPNSTKFGTAGPTKKADISEEMVTSTSNLFHSPIRSDRASKGASHFVWCCHPASIDDDIAPDAECLLCLHNLFDGEVRRAALLAHERERTPADNGAELLQPRSVRNAGRSVGQVLSEKAAGKLPFPSAKSSAVTVEAQEWHLVPVLNDFWWFSARPQYQVWSARRCLLVADDERRNYVTDNQVPTTAAEPADSFGHGLAKIVLGSPSRSRSGAHRAPWFTGPAKAEMPRPALPGLRRSWWP